MSTHRLRTIQNLSDLSIISQGRGTKYLTLTALLYIRSCVTYILWSPEISTAVPQNLLSCLLNRYERVSTINRRETAQNFGAHIMKCGSMEVSVFEKDQSILCVEAMVNTGCKIFAHKHTCTFEVWCMCVYIDGLLQSCSISNTNTLEILQSCTEPSI